MLTIMSSNQCFDQHCLREGTISSYHACLYNNYKMASQYIVKDEGDAGVRFTGNV